SRPAWMKCALCRCCTEAFMADMITCRSVQFTYNSITVLHSRQALWRLRAGGSNQLRRAGGRLVVLAEHVDLAEEVVLEQLGGFARRNGLVHQLHLHRVGGSREAAD